MSSKDCGYTGDAYQLRRVEGIFHQIVDLDPTAQQLIIAQLCEGDEALEAEVRELLDASGAAEAVAAVRCGESRLDRWIGCDAGPYRIERLLGRGGMGAVYLASRHDGEFQLRVAVKVLASRLVSSVMLERFAIERQILANLSHPNIVRLLDGGVTAGGEPYLVMEYVDGVPLDQWVKRNATRPKGLELRKVMELFVCICDAVSAAHRKLVIHRDLKPANILVTDSGEPKLLDFGTSKLLEGSSAGSRLTEMGFRAFTPEYASPEQVLGGKLVSTPSDVYSLGVILYRLASAGVPPYRFGAQSSAEYVRVLNDVEPAPPSQVSGRAELRGDLDAIILKAMRKDPDQRYGGAGELAADLRAWLEGRPVSAREPTWSYRVSRLILKHRVALTAGGAVALVLATGTALTASAAREARRQEALANRQFRNVRELNRALLFDFFDEVQKLPGSMDVQKQIVNQSLEYIRSMQKEAPDDVEASYDLVDAYMRLGNVYGNPYYDNLSNPKAGTEALQMGLDLATSLLRRNPSDDRARRLMAHTYQNMGEVLLGAADAQGAGERLRKAIAEFDQLSARPSASADALVDAASAHGALSDIVLGIHGGKRDEVAAESELHRAIELNHQAVKAAPDYARGRRSLVVHQFKMGRLVMDTRPGDAATAFDAALRELEKLPREIRSSIEILRLIAAIEWRSAAAWNAIGDHDQALQHARESRRMCKSIERLDPSNSRSQMDLAAALYHEASSLDLRGAAAASEKDTRESHRIYLEHLALLRKLLAPNSGNAMLQSHLTESLLRIAQVEFKLGMRASATAALRESRRVGKELSDPIGAWPIVLQRTANAFGSALLPPSEWDLPRARHYAERLNRETGNKRAEYLYMLASIYNRLSMAAEARQTLQEAAAWLLREKPGASNTILSRQIQEALRTWAASSRSAGTGIRPTATAASKK